VAAALAVTPRGLAGAGTRADEGPAPDDGVLDDALRLLQDREPESRQGLSTHAPMVAEALCALGRSDQVLIWVERYRGPLLELPRPRQRIVPQDWRAALGARPGAATWEEALGRWADWRELFVEEMKEAPWPQVERDLLIEDTLTLPVQVNGKKRAEVTVGRNAANAEIEAAVLALDAVKRALDGKPPKKVIVVPQRIINVVA
jgi:hypothetical protein